MTDRAYQGKRVLITGATGLVGSWLTHALLEAGAEVHCLVIPDPEPASQLRRSKEIERVTVHTGRLENEGSVRTAVVEAAPDVVFHLGAQPLVERAHEDPVGTFRPNVAGTWSLLEACRTLARPRAIVVASSDKAYGPSDHLPYRETDPLGGSEPYEASKAMTDILARTYATSYGVPVRVARCGNLYGSGDWNWSRIVPGTIKALLAGERPVLRSDGTPVRDYLYVDDVVSAYLALGAQDLPAGEAFNFSSGERLSVLQVVDAIGKAVGKALTPVILGTARGEIAEQYLDSTKARARLGWQARRRMAEALPGVVAWYRELLAA